jgi:tartrate dehydratase alpha subunit/fumarate hydratase class I-like protein
MKTAMAEEPSATQSGQALAIIAENIDLAADCEGAICQDTGMPTFEVKTPGWRQPDRDAETDPGCGGGGDAPRKAEAQFG